MHPHRSAIHDRVKKLPAQIRSRYYLSSRCARQRPCPFRAARRDANYGPGMREGESGGARRASGSHEQNPAPLKPHAALEAAQNSDVVGIVTVEPPSATHNHGIDRTNARSQGIAFIE